VVWEGVYRRSAGAVIALLVVCTAMLSGCGGGNAAPALVDFRPQRAPLMLYPGHAPTLAPGTESGTPAASLTLTNSPVPTVSMPLPGAAQYLVYEPNYTGPFSVTSSCDPAAVAAASFETQVTPQNGGGYSFTPGPTGTGPGAILDVKSSGVLGPQTCTLTVRDERGNAATIAVTGKQLLLYRDTNASFGPGLSGSAFVLDVTFAPGSFYVYEQGYSGGYTLAPSSCAAFKATLNAPVDPSGPAVLTLAANGPPTPEICTFAISDSNGNRAFVEAAYEGAP
jgi:hypothetical protein